MGQFSPTEVSKPEVRSAPTDHAPRGSWWIWVVVAVLIVAGFRYYRSASANSPAQAAGAPGSSSPGFPNAIDPANLPPVPVVVTTAQHGDLPVYFDGLGTVTAYNTVTVRSRVDGAIVKVNFTEGQFVHEGDLLVEIDPRPYQVALEQAQGQLARDEALLKNSHVDLERYKILLAQQAIPQQQLATQEALVGQYEGTIKTDQANVDSAKLNLTYAHITSPITGLVGLRLVGPGNIVHATDANGLLVITQ